MKSVLQKKNNKWKINKSKTKNKRKIKKITNDKKVKAKQTENFLKTWTWTMKVTTNVILHEFGMNNDIWYRGYVCGL